MPCWKPRDMPRCCVSARWGPAMIAATRWGRPRRCWPALRSARWRWCGGMTHTRHEWLGGRRDRRSAAAGEVLRHAYDEARLRRAPLRVVTTWQSLYVDIHDNLAAADRQKLAKAKIDRRLAKWERSYPDVDMRAAAVHCNSRAYLTKNADSIQLLVVGRERADGIRELVVRPGPRRCTMRIVQC